MITITIDGDKPVGDTEKAVLIALLFGNNNAGTPTLQTADLVAPEPTVKAATVVSDKKGPAARPPATKLGTDAMGPKIVPVEEPVADSEPEPAGEIPSEEDVSFESAVATATKFVADGKINLVKKALTAVGAKRVSELKTDNIPAFLAALNA